MYHNLFRITLLVTAIATMQAACRIGQAARANQPILQEVTSCLAFGLRDKLCSNGKPSTSLT